MYFKSIESPTSLFSFHDSNFSQHIREAFDTYKAQILQFLDNKCTSEVAYVQPTMTTFLETICAYEQLKVNGLSFYVVREAECDY